MTVINLFREKSKLTGQPMFIGCPHCDCDEWAVTVKNIEDKVVVFSLMCIECESVATVQDGVIDE